MGLGDGDGDGEVRQDDSFLLHDDSFLLHEPNYMHTPRYASVSCNAQGAGEDSDPYIPLAEEMNFCHS